MKPSKGFTLLEILVAFILLALVGGSLLQLFQGGLHNLDSSAEISHATLLAKSKLTELSALGSLKEGETDGEFDDKYRFELTLEPYLEHAGEELPDTDLQAYLTTLDILWGETGRYRVRTLMLSPPESP